jgi:hypothetical protein
MINNNNNEEESVQLQKQKVSRVTKLTLGEKIDELVSINQNPVH